MLNNKRTVQMRQYQRPDTEHEKHKSMTETKLEFLALGGVGVIERGDGREMAGAPQRACYAGCDDDAP